jgi:hypothetical protein
VSPKQKVAGGRRRAAAGTPGWRARVCASATLRRATLPADGRDLFARAARFLIVDEIVAPAIVNFLLNAGSA